MKKIRGWKSGHQHRCFVGGSSKRHFRPSCEVAIMGIFVGIVPVMLPSHENWKREIGSTNQPAAGVLGPSQLFSSTTSPVRLSPPSNAKRLLHALAPRQVPSMDRRVLQVEIGLQKPSWSLVQRWVRSATRGRTDQFPPPLVAVWTFPYLSLWFIWFVWNELRFGIRKGNWQQGMGDDLEGWTVWSEVTGCFGPRSS